MTVLVNLVTNITMSPTSLSFFPRIFFIPYSRHQLSEQLICDECLSETNAERQTLKPKCFTLEFHQMCGNIAPGAQNITDVFADHSIPVMVVAATRALENEIQNLHSSYRSQIDSMRKDWRDQKFVFQSRYKM